MVIDEIKEEFREINRETKGKHRGRWFKFWHYAEWIHQRNVQRLQEQRHNNQMDKYRATHQKEIKEYRKKYYADNGQ